MGARPTRQPRKSGRDNKFRSFSPPQVFRGRGQGEGTDGIEGSLQTVQHSTRRRRYCCVYAYRLCGASAISTGARQHKSFAAGGRICKGAQAGNCESKSRLLVSLFQTNTHTQKQRPPCTLARRTPPAHPPLQDSISCTCGESPSVPAVNRHRFGYQHVYHPTRTITAGEASAATIPGSPSLSSLDTASLEFSSEEAYHEHLEGQGKLPLGFRVGTDGLRFVPQEVASEAVMNVTAIVLDEVGR